MPKIEFTEREVEIHYAIAGEGPPLVMLTGVMGAISFYWKVLLPYLQKEFTLYMIDNRASGQTTDKGKPFTIDDLVEDTIAFIRNFGLEGAPILGHSMGSAIALLLGDRYGSEVGPLILCNCFARINHAAEIVFSSALDLLHEGVPFSKVLWTLTPWFYSPEFIKKERFKLEVFVKQLHIPIEDLERQCQALVNFDASDVLSRVTNETLIIASEGDVLTPLLLAEEMAKAMPNAHLVVIEGGHASTVEQPEALARLVIDFLYRGS
jgi:pimeloyl-ACP methyl ester carboxylesterase